VLLFSISKKAYEAATSAIPIPRIPIYIADETKKLRSKKIGRSKAASSPKLWSPQTQKDQHPCPSRSPFSQCASSLPSSDPAAREGVIRRAQIRSRERLATIRKKNSVGSSSELPSAIAQRVTWRGGARGRGVSADMNAGGLRREAPDPAVGGRRS
jgi:hypothetical protein